GFRARDGRCAPRGSSARWDSVARGLGSRRTWRSPSVEQELPRRSADRRAACRRLLPGVAVEELPLDLAAGLYVVPEHRVGHDVAVVGGGVDVTARQEDDAVPVV